MAFGRASRPKNGNGASLSVPIFMRQTRALILKNAIQLRRRWLLTLVQSLVLPLALLGIFLNLDRFTTPRAVYGTGKPFPVLTLAQSLESGSGDLLFVHNDTLGPDVKRVVDRIKEPLSHMSDRLVDLKDPNSVFDHCKTNQRGVSSCHAALVFMDSPLTPQPKAGAVGNWSYMIRTDPSRTGNEWFWSVNFNVNDNTPSTSIWLPLQLGVAAAISNTTYNLDIFSYTFKTQAEADAAADMRTMMKARGLNSLLYFVPLLLPVFHVVSRITTERNEGVSQLIDVSGGGPAARVYSYVVTFNVLYLPFSIISGIFYQQFLFRRLHAAPIIFWFILITMSFINFAVFAAAFFQGPRISSVMVAAIFVAITIGSLVSDGGREASDQSNLALSAIFPASNYVFSIGLMAWQGYREGSLDFGKTQWNMWGPQKMPVHGVALWEYFLFAILHILAYPLLAVAAERLTHGISFTRREFHDDDAAVASTESIRVCGLRKTYPPSIWRKIFCCGRRPETVTALDGVDLTAQKSQIMCLLGVNGSGKTTTLDIISGMQKSTAGSVQINSSFTKLGVCPQKNVLFPFLTCFEHVKIWSQIKHGSESTETLTKLIEYCNLKAKMHSRARDLSGGQKRKLQLACMLAGGSEVLLLDEVTSGLDPISRRAIWDIILGERAKRSMIFTTHFLDEAEVLADHITLLSKGKIMCQGSGAELKNRFGGGYVVHIPKNEREAPDMGVPTTVHQDRVRYHVQDTKSAAVIIAKLEAQGISGVTMDGPTIEQVFLSLTSDVDEALRRELGQGPKASANLHEQPTTTTAAAAPAALQPGRPISLVSQTLILMRKRLTILPRYWVAPLLALGLAAGVPAALKSLLINPKAVPPLFYQRPTCAGRPQELNWVPDYDFPSRVYVQTPPWSGGGEEQTTLPLGPSSWRSAAETAMLASPVASPWYNHTQAWSLFRFEDSQELWYDTVRNGSRWGSYGGIFITGNSTESSSAIVANAIEYFSPAMGLVSLWTTMRGGQNISVYTGSIPRPSSVSTEEGIPSMEYAMFASLILGVYPVFFALYPAYEKSHNVRALQYANGVRPAPMWIAHLLSDFVVVLLASVSLVATVSSQITMFWQPGFLFFVSVLYGLAGILTGYIVASKLTSSQLAAFMTTLFIVVVQLVGAILSFTLPKAYVEPAEVQNLTEILSWTLGVFFPIVNVYKSFLIGLNTFRIACRASGPVEYPGHIYAYGGPILLLLIQVIFLLLLLIWLESNNSFAALGALINEATKRRRRRGAQPPGPAWSEGEEERESGAAGHGAAKERMRVDTSSAVDLLQVSHVSKAYGSTQAVEDVTLGLGEGEIMALLGPNGGGKTTMVNMIMGELRPDSGQIRVCGVDVHRQTRLAQRSLGVCQQFDAPDLMTARQHLEFYGRIKGVADVARDVQAVLERTGLGPHADRAASRLSGGNRRKLSLGIALMGSPDVVVLDEPSSAMDAASKRVMWRTLAEVGPGRSLLLTTHSLEEADALCTRAAILSRRLLAVGTTQELRRRYSDVHHLQLVLASAPRTPAAETARVEAWVRSRFPAVVAAAESLGGQLKFTVPASVSIAAIITALEEAKEELGLLTYGVGQPTLENVFISVVKDQYVEEDGKKKAWWQLWG